jgi:hypothetical protein
MRLGRVWLLVAVFLAGLPASALAQARGHAGRPSPGPSAGFHSGFAHHHFGGRFHHRTTTVTVFAWPFFGAPLDYYAPPVYTPPVVYTPPPVVYPSVAYPPATSYAPPSVAYSPAPPPPTSPPPPPMPRSVEFGSGRYELRGDGLNTPYVWVWIPNPPSAPPTSSAARSAPARVYRWTDDNGVTTLTDDLEKVPARFRAQVTQTQP